MEKRPPRSRHPVPGESVERLSISISAEDKEGLVKIASDKRVSLAWVIRDAVTQYLACSVENSHPAEKLKG